LTVNRIYVVNLSATLFVLSWAVTQPIYPLYVLELGATTFELGILLSLSSLLQLVFRIPLTLLGERIGRVRMLLASLLVSSSAAALYALARSPPHLFLLVIYQSVATCSYNQIAMSIASDMAQTRRQGDIMGRYLTFLGLGMLLGPATCGALVTYLSYGQLFLLSAAFPLLGFALLALWPPAAPRAARGGGGEARPGALESLRMIVSDRNVVLLSYCRAAFSTAHAIFAALFAVYAVQQLGMNPSIVALLFTLRGLANTLARFPAGRLSDRIGRRRPMMFAYGAVVLVYVVVASVGGVAFIAAALVLYGVAWGTRAVSEWAFLADVVRPEVKTISISYLSSVFGLGSTLGSALAGALSMALPMQTIFLLAAALNLPSILAVAVMGRPANMPEA